MARGKRPRYPRVALTARQHQRRLGPYQIGREVARSPGLVLAEGTMPDGATFLIQMISLNAAQPVAEAAIRASAKMTAERRVELNILDHSAVIRPDGGYTLFWALPWRRRWQPVQRAVWSWHDIAGAAASVGEWLADQHRHQRAHPTLSGGTIMVDDRGELSVVGVPIAFDETWYAGDMAPPPWAPEEAPAGPATPSGDLWRFGHLLRTLIDRATSPPTDEGLRSTLDRAIRSLTAVDAASRPRSADAVVEALTDREARAWTVNTPAMLAAQDDFLFDSVDTEAYVVPSELDNDAPENTSSAIAQAIEEALHPSEARESANGANGNRAGELRDGPAVSARAPIHELETKRKPASHPQTVHDLSKVGGSPHPPLTPPRRDGPRLPLPNREGGPAMSLQRQQAGVSVRRARAETPGAAFAPSAPTADMSPMGEALPGALSMPRRSTPRARAVSVRPLSSPPPPPAPTPLPRPILPPPPPERAGPTTPKSSPDQLRWRRPVVFGRAFALIWIAGAGLLFALGIGAGARWSRPATVTAVVASPPALIRSDREVVLLSTPSGADVVAEADGRVLGQTPLRLLTPTDLPLAVLVDAEGFVPVRLPLPSYGVLTAHLAPADPASSCHVTAVGAPGDQLTAHRGDQTVPGTVRIEGAAVFRQSEGGRPVGARLIRCLGISQPGPVALNLRPPHERNIRLSAPDDTEVYLDGQPLSAMPADAATKRAFVELRAKPVGGEAHTWLVGLGTKATTIHVVTATASTIRADLSAPVAAAGRSLAPARAPALAGQLAPPPPLPPKRREAAERARGRAVRAATNGRLKLARARFRRCVTLDPHHADCHLGIAEIYRRLDFGECSIGHYRRYLALQPDGASAVEANDRLEPFMCTLYGVCP